MRLSGYIVSNDDKWFYDWYGVDSICPQEVIDALASLSGMPLTVKIDNGYGGSIIAGATIFEEFMSYSGTVDFIVTGLAASEHFVIAMASAKKGNACKMSPLAMIMMHNVQGSREGDYRALEHEAQVLRSANETLVSAFRMKTGKSNEEIQALLDAESWLNPQEALDLGLIDGILHTDEFPEGSEPPADIMAVAKRAMRGMAACIRPPSEKMLGALRAAAKPPTEEPPEDDPPPGPDDSTIAQAVLDLEKQRYGGNKL